jgi:PAS domain S-box-containing protein
MMALHRFTDWPLRAKMAVLFVVVSLLPLGVATWINIEEARERLVANTAALLAARGDQLIGRLDTFNFGYQRTVSRVARLPDVVEFFQAGPADADRLKPRLSALLNGWPATDANIRGVALLDLSGVMKFATDDTHIGADLSYRRFVRDALRGVAVTSDIYFADPEGDVPTIAFLAPVLGPDRQLLGLAAFWVHASALWNVMKASNELAGPGSFAVLFDHLGIRIAHTYSDDIVFHPGGRLAPATIDALVAERRFGGQTRQLLEDVRAFPEQFERSLAQSPDKAVFRGFAPVNRKWNYGVGRRFQTVPWTVFYMIPEDSLLAQIGQMTREKTVFAAVILLLALMAGALFAAVILKPLGSLSAAARAITGGDLTARVAIDRADELGKLGTTFNTMAGRIETQAAALVQESEAKYRTLFETLIEGFCTIEMIFDASGNPVDYRFLEINPAFETQTGLHNAQGRLMRDLAPDHEAHWFEIYGKVALTGEPVHFENEARALGRHYDVHAYRVGGPESRKVAILFNDITERNIAQRKLRAQFERLNLLQQITRAIGERQDTRSIFQVVVRTLEEQLPLQLCCICLYDPTDNVLTVTSVGLASAALAMDLALTEQARIAIDQNGLSRCVSGQLVYEPDISEVPFPFPERLAAGGLRSMVAAPLRLESTVFGVLIAARVQARSFTSGDCEFLLQLSEHIALAAHQAQLHGSLKKAYDDLRETQQAVMQQERLRALGQMASGIAHDINNAISPVALYSEHLLEREPNLSADGRRYLEIIRRAIEDVAQTVGRMREFYRQREQQMTLLPVDLNALARQVADLTRARWSDMAHQRGIVIEMQTELAPDLPAIAGAESEIREALTNLVFNAVDAMPQGGTLTLRTEANSRSAWLEVIDTGVGMDEGTRRRCFEPFFTTKGERGTGLGLAMVYGVMQRHSAEIEIESVLGRGTTIRLSFARPTAALGSGVRMLPLHAAPSALRVLLVDDDPVLLKSLEDILTADGHILTVTHGGQAGIDAFRVAHEQGNSFDVVITDLGMPYVDGRKVAGAVKALAPSAPVILLTGWGQRLEIEGDVPAHVDRVLSKPPKLRELREALIALAAGGH